MSHSTSLATTLNGSPRSKRLSLPGSTSSNLPPVHLNPLSASTSSIPIASARAALPNHTLKHPTKKTLSPSHAQRRSVSSHPTSSSSSSSQSSAPTSVQDGTLLALPLAKQLQSLKERNASLAQSTSNSNAKLVKATERIRQLEESLVKAEESRGIDAEGWEAEASRLAHELQALQQSNEVEMDSRVSALERSLELEQARKRRAKEMIAKLRCELINRRWKEKYEIELLEREERNWEIRTVELEFELAVVKGELSSERLEREELEVRSILSETAKAYTNFVLGCCCRTDDSRYSEETNLCLDGLSQTSSRIVQYLRRNHLFPPIFSRRHQS